MAEKNAGADWEIDLIIQQFDVVRATFQPQDMDTLKEGAASWIGWRGEWSAGWVIDDGGPYAGTFAMGIRCSRPVAPFLWAPQCDLADIELLDRLEYGTAEVKLVTKC